MALLPFLLFANLIAALTFGSIEPGANWPSSMYFSVSSMVIISKLFSVGLL